jgi:hypothetical protein
MKKTTENALMIFMKYPVKGRVKTRLAKDIGDETALAIYKSLVEKTLYGVRNPQTHYLDILIYLDDENHIGETARWLNVPRKNIFIQNGIELGVKLANAFKEQFLRYEKIIVIGTDIPGLDSGIIEKSLECLDQSDVVIGPAVDGGYYLLGSKKFHPELFSGIDWSTHVVLRQTLEIIHNQNMKYTLLEEKRDIDTLDDLKELNYENFSNNSGV